MKKIGIFVGAILLALAVLAPAQISEAESSGDQACVAAESIPELISPGTTPREQSFIPTQNRLEMVNVWLDGPGFAGDQAVVVSVLNTNKETLGSSEFYPTFEIEGPQIRTGEYNPAIVLTPGQIYYIKVDVLDGPNNLNWYRSVGDCYTSGNAFGESPEPWDFLFVTMGYTYTTPSEPATTTTPTTTSNTSTTSSNSGTPTVTIPQTSTSTSIKTPTAPSAVYDGEGKAISLSWKASTTTDIDGYIISRSTDNQTFSDLGMTTKAVLSYTDQAVIAGQTYYYKVRAYKGALSSAFSDVISAAAPAAETAAATVSTEKSTDQPVAVAEKEGFFTNRNIILMAGSLVVLLLVIWEIMMIVARKRGVKIADLFKKAKNPSPDVQ